MPLIECSGLTRDYAGTPVLSGVDFSIEEGEKLALVGPNGAGKTTLLRILLGLDDDYRGRLVRKPKLRVGFVPQRFEAPPGLSAAALVEAPAREALARLEALGEALSTAKPGEEAELLDAWTLAREAYERSGGEDSEERARRLLAMVGLAHAADSEAALLSGGELNVLSVALALSGDPELLVLDEPGNHLDFWGLAWLEDFLAKLPAAVLLVSHDRRFVDAVATRVVELERGRATSYAGGWSAYRLEKLGRAAGQGERWQADRKRLERLEALVARFAEIARARADPAWGKRLRARRSQLEREKAKATERPSGSGRAMDARIQAEASKADFALRVEDYHRELGGRVLYDHAEFDLIPGERVALVGPNGCGKTTFLRDVVQAERGGSGALRVAPGAILGYCPQEAPPAKPGSTVASTIEALGAKRDEAAKHLGRFLFSWGDLDKPVASLSGGERKRLDVAAAAWLRADFLLLDEPTNHLDVAARESLEEALEAYEGTVLMVSHDRWFLERLAGRILLIEGARFVPYEGGFAEFWRDVGSSRVDASRGLGARGAAKARVLEGAAAKAGAKKPALADGRGKSAKGRGGKTAADAARDAETERRILALESEKVALERQAAKAIAERDFALAGRLARDLAEKGRLVERLYASWGG